MSTINCQYLQSLNSLMVPIKRPLLQNEIKNNRKTGQGSWRLRQDCKVKVCLSYKLRSNQPRQLTRFCLKMENKQRAGDVAKGVECLSSMWETIASIPRTEHKWEQRGAVITCKKSKREEQRWRQLHGWLPLQRASMSQNQMWVDSAQVSLSALYPKVLPWLPLQHNRGREDHTQR